MPKKTYGCTDCNKTFSRKYNAERHNETIHNQMAKIYNKETGWKLNNNQKTNNAYQVQQDSFSSSSTPHPTSSSKATTTTATSSILSDLDNQNKNSNINNMSNQM